MKRAFSVAQALTLGPPLQTVDSWLSPKRGTSHGGSILSVAEVEMGSLCGEKLSSLRTQERGGPPKSLVNIRVPGVGG